PPPAPVASPTPVPSRPDRHVHPRDPRRAPRPWTWPFVYKVFDDDGHEAGEVEFEGEVLPIAESPADRSQIKLLVAREADRAARSAPRSVPPLATSGTDRQSVG